MGKTAARPERAPEFKSFAFKLDGPPDDEGRFSGSAAVFGNVDKGNDLIEAGATTKTIQENPEVPIFWVHEYDLVPIGIGTLSTDGKKSTRIEGQLFIESSELAREVFGAMKAGAVKGLSIGYNTIKRYFKGAVRHLQEIAIGEVSLCPFPMNPLAEVDTVKAQKWLGQYGATESVDCVLSAIGTLTDYLASEVAEGDTEDVARLETVLPILATCLQSEIEDVAAGESEDEDDAEVVAVYVEMMREPVELAVKKLQALLEQPEPASATRSVKRAAEQDATEPDVSTLRALIADIKSAA